MTETDQLGKWATVRQVAEKYRIFSESSLRYLIFNSKQNGLEKCLRRIGAKLLINLKQFDQWIDSHQEQGGVK